MSERPMAMAPNSLPSVVARDATTRGCLAKFMANLRQDVLGAIRSAMPNTGRVNSRSSGTASSSKPSALLETTVLHLLGNRPFRPTGRLTLNTEPRGNGGCGVFAVIRVDAGMAEGRTHRHTTGHA